MDELEGRVNEQCSHDDFDSRDDTRAEERAHESETDGQCLPHARSRKSGRKRTNSGDHQNGRNQQLPDDAGKVGRSVTARYRYLAQDREDIQLVTRTGAKAMGSPTTKGPRKTEALGEVSAAQAAPGS